ncbi:MAG: hypothetical protein K9M10_00255 [Candidatus Pacebacteria bacterium]|nr:hypothetical protein [Candidatus Paceibacterota bacterium]MCF7856898.1 hypothetical protein [Candidatus Paceibacterota bacterium]
MTTEWIQVLQYSFQTLWVEVVSFLPQFLIAFLILIVGWIIGGVLKRIVEKVFATLKVDQLLDMAGVDELSEKAGYKLRAGAFVGSLVKWFTIIVFFVASLDVLNLDQVTVFFREVVLSYLPQVIVAVLILFGAMIIAKVVDTSIVATSRAAGFSSPDLLGHFARYAILVLAVLAALSHLQIAPQLVEMLFAGFVFATSLALGLAFGLGGKETAAHWLNAFTQKKNDHMNHR